MDAQESVIREVEQSVLDKHYQNYDILLWPDDFIVPYLLKGWGDIARQLKGPGYEDHSAFVIRRQLNMYIQALGWCIKWILQNNSPQKKAKLSDKMMIKKVTEAIEWGVHYHALVQNHVAWSRGQLKIEINTDTKEITFLPPELKVFQFVLGQELSSEEIFDGLQARMPILEVSNYYFQRRTEINWKKPPITFDGHKAKTESIFLVVFQWIEKTILPEIDNLYDLGNYTVEDLRKVFTGIFIHTTLICFAEDEIDENTGYENPFGSNPICLPRKAMIRLLNQWSGAPELKIDAILDDFIFDIDNFHSSLTNQPIVKTKNGNLILVPRIFLHTEYNRLTSGALNKKAKKSVYDRIINTIEAKNLDSLELFFSINGLAPLKEIAFKSKSQTITPDFILLDEPNQSIFVVDYKHYLIPLNANETLFKLSEINKAIRQVKSYKTFIQNHPELLKKHYPQYDERYSITPMLLCKWPIPVPISIEDEIRVLTINQLERILSDHSHSLRNRIDNFYRDLIKGLEDTPYDLKLTQQIIKVADWSYVRSIYVGQRRS